MTNIYCVDDLWRKPWLHILIIRGLALDFCCFRPNENRRKKWRIWFPSLPFLDPQYYDRFLLHRKIHMENGCDGIKPQNPAVVKTKFSNSEEKRVINRRAFSEHNSIDRGNALLYIGVGVWTPNTLLINLKNELYLPSCRIKKKYWGGYNRNKLLKNLEERIYFYIGKIYWDG